MKRQTNTVLKEKSTKKVMPYLCIFHRYGETYFSKKTQ